MTTTDFREKITHAIHGDWITYDDLKKGLIDDGATTSESVDAIMSLVESYNKEMLEDVIGDDEQAVMGRGVPGYTENLLRKEQRKRATTYFTPNTKKGE